MRSTRALRRECITGCPGGGIPGKRDAAAVIARHRQVRRKRGPPDTLLMMPTKHQYFDRYRLPVMHTETNLPDDDRAPAWIRKEWANVHRLREDGVPMIGFTYYSLTDQVDWDTALVEDNGNVNPLGLYDLDRKDRPAGETYREIIRQWRDILPTQSHSLYLNCYELLKNADRLLRRAARNGPRGYSPSALYMYLMQRLKSSRFGAPVRFNFRQSRSYHSMTPSSCSPSVSTRPCGSCPASASSSRTAPHWSGLGGCSFLQVDAYWDPCLRQPECDSVF